LPAGSVDEDVLSDAAQQWAMDHASQPRVQLDQSPFVVALLGLRRTPQGKICHPDLRWEQGRWWFAAGTPFAFCPAVLMTLQLLPAEAVLDSATLAKQSHYLEESDGPPPTDAMPHNLGFAHLAWQPSTGTLSGVGPVMFDTKYTRAVCPWTASVNPPLESDVCRCWRTAAVWHSTLAEFGRQVYLQHEYSLLYTQFWHEAQARAAASHNRFLKTIRVAIKLDHLDQHSPTTTQLIASLNPREAA
jgi:hypothetical protein